MHDLKQATSTAEAEAQARSTWRDTELVETENAWKDAEARADTASRALEARSDELQAERQMALAAGATYEEMRASFEQRIRDLERELADRARAVAALVESPEVEIEITLDELAPDDERPTIEDARPAMVAALLEPPDQPLRSASRHAFNSAMHVLIDGGAAALVDLSTTGAQVISPTPLKPNRVVKLQLPSDTAPFACKGKIVWARLEPPTAGGPLRYRAGVYFMGVDVAAVVGFLAEQSTGH